MKKKLLLAILIPSVAIATLGVTAYFVVPKIIDYLNDHPFPPKVLPNKIHVACIGDSITWGAGVWNQRHKATYEVLLNEKLDDHYQVLNYGLNGRTLMDEADYPYKKESFYTVSHEINAEKYIVMLGSNDSKDFNWPYAGDNGENFKRQLKEMLQSYINLPSNPEVIVMQPPKAFPIDGAIPWHINNDNIKNGVVPFVKQVGDELGIDVVNLYALTENNPEWFPDGVHPNKEGNAAIAEALYQVINK